MLLATKLFFTLALFRFSCALMEKISDSKEPNSRIQTRPKKLTSYNFSKTSNDVGFLKTSNAVGFSKTSNAVGFSKTSNADEKSSRRRNATKFEILEVPNFEIDEIYDQTFSVNGIANQLLQVRSILKLPLRIPCQCHPPTLRAHSISMGNFRHTFTQWTLLTNAQRLLVRNVYFSRGPSAY